MRTFILQFTFFTLILIASIYLFQPLNIHADAGSTVSSGNYDPTTSNGNTSNQTLVRPCTGNVQGDGNKSVATCDWQDVLAQISRIVKFILWIGTFYIIGLTIYAGFLLITSSGDSAKLTKAKSLFWDVIVGFLVIIGAYFIVVFTLDAFKVKQDYRIVGPNGGSSGNLDINTGV